MTRPTDPNGRRMKSWLPPIWYEQSQSSSAILESEGEGLTQYQADTADVNAARMPQTAPDWGLTRFEQELGLSVDPPGFTSEDRRGRIMARFRGIGTTIYRLKQIAGSFGYGDIAILPGIEDWTLYVQFLDVIGVPGGLEAHEAELRNNIEAHLDVQFAFHFTLWNEVRNTGVLWCQLKTAGAGGTGPSGELTWSDMKTVPYQNMPTTLECAGEPAGSLVLEVVDQTLLGNTSLMYPTTTITGNPSAGTTDPITFPLD